LLPQRPADLFVHERVGDEVRGAAGDASLRRFGLERLKDADPRDLSGGERQRLALAIALAGRDPQGGELPGALLLDEPTRGMDRARKADLATLVRELAEEGCALVVATHDVEFAATFADRVVLLGRGEVAADGSAEELLSGGWYFSSEVARILDGAAITVEAGAAALRDAGAGRTRTEERAR
jgi:energy-coupling factor transport system ATP-binding protein